MLNVGLTFATVLFTMYSMFQFIIQQDEYFKKLFLLHIMWCIYYLFFFIVVIHSSNTLTIEVNHCDARCFVADNVFIMGNLVFFYPSGQTYCMDCTRYQKLLRWFKHHFIRMWFEFIYFMSKPYWLLCITRRSFLMLMLLHKVLYHFAILFICCFFGWLWGNVQKVDSTVSANTTSPPRGLLSIFYTQLEIDVQCEEIILCWKKWKTS